MVPVLAVDVSNDLLIVNIARHGVSGTLSNRMCRTRRHFLVLPYCFESLRRRVAHAFCAALDRTSVRVVFARFAASEGVPAVKPKPTPVPPTFSFRT